MEHRAFHAFVFTVSNVQAPFVQLEALIDRINDDKLMFILCHLEICKLEGKRGPRIVHNYPPKGR